MSLSMRGNRTQGLIDLTSRKRSDQALTGGTKEEDQRQGTSTNHPATDATRPTG